MSTAKAQTRHEIQSDYFLVRLGTLGHIGRFQRAEAICVSRANRVICRTTRGVEMGLILGPATIDTDAGVDLADGKILRRMTPEDELLWGHLCQLGRDAHDSCVDWLREHGVAATLLDVEPLMDGKTLYFHFLSEVGSDVQTHLDQLVAIYEQSAGNSQFARLLENGCGPGCGTAEATSGCGAGGKGCAVCKIASRCNR